jgi:hypothetical protein
MDGFLNLFVFIVCISGPVFFVVAVFLGFMLYKQAKSHDNKKLLHEKNLSEKHESEKELIRSKLDEVERQKVLSDVVIAGFENKIRALENDALSALCSDWRNEIIHTSYGSEIEVEVKFVYPLMRFLGYRINDLKMRVQVESQFGRQKVTGIADWVVYNQATGKPHIVIEAKDSTQRLDGPVQEQARSYAFALGAPMYLMTNGKEIVVYERNIEQDFCKLNLRVDAFSENWKMLELIIGQVNQ